MIEILWFIATITSLNTGTQSVLDQSEWIVIETWTGCNDGRYVASHDRKDFWKEIKKLKKWDTVTIRDCKYTVASKRVVNRKKMYIEDLIATGVYLQTCTKIKNFVYLIKLK
jgi:hypothetical protein